MAISIYTLAGVFLGVFVGRIVIGLIAIEWEQSQQRKRERERPR